MGKTKKSGNIEKISGKSLDITADKIQQLKQIFPEAVKEGKIDSDKLAQVLNKESAEGDERYGLSWAGKITKKFVDKVLAEKPERFTCLDAAFKNNDQLKTNTALQMEGAKIKFKVI